MAVCVRIAMLNPAIPAKHLWDKEQGHVYDPRLNAACPFAVFQWLNRHLSFGE